MAYTASIYFLGQYRPAHFEATSPTLAAGVAIAAMMNTERAEQAREWLVYCAKRLRRAGQDGGYSSTSCEHGCFGVTVREGAHDPWLDRSLAEMPDCPGMDYSLSSAQRELA